MPTFVEATLDADAFPLGRALDVDLDLDVAVELEPVLPTAERAAPPVWVAGPDRGAVGSALERDPRVRAVRRHATLRESALVSVEWTEPRPGPVDAVDDADGTVLYGVAHADSWSFTLRFPDRGGIEAFSERAADRGLDVDLERVYAAAAADVSEPRGEASGVDPAGHEYGLTNKQRTALATALREGYFRVPREVTQEELATELGVQSSAVSETLRRATAELVGTTLGEAPVKE